MEGDSPFWSGDRCFFSIFDGIVNNNLVERTG